MIEKIAYRVTLGLVVIAVPGFFIRAAATFPSRTALFTLVIVAAGLIGYAIDKLILQDAKGNDQDD